MQNCKVLNKDSNGFRPSDFNRAISPRTASQDIQALNCFYMFCFVPMSSFQEEKVAQLTPFKSNLSGLSLEFKFITSQVLLFAKIFIVISLQEGAGWEVFTIIWGDSPGSKH